VQATTLVSSSVASTKRKAVINAEKSQLEQVQRLVADGRYRTVSEFVREAVAEKLERIEQDEVSEAVARYCAAGHAGEDVELIGAQAFEGARQSRPRTGSRRASR
ncbi:MAG: ribbon-helix-helix domain-containing protein, partial [Candidatus Binatia bacterium]